MYFREGEARSTASYETPHFYGGRDAEADEGGPSVGETGARAVIRRPSLCKDMTSSQPWPSVPNIVSREIEQKCGIEDSVERLTHVCSALLSSLMLVHLLVLCAVDRCNQ